MNSNWLIKAALVGLLSPTLISCASLERILHLSSVERGKVEAGVHIPDQPPDCRKTEPHASTAIGDESRSVLKRERKITERLNARILRCADDRDNVTAKIEGAVP